uniref:Uncharacterized protein n=1 Tax=Ixodes ricinus TaxID=34613 RepID=A0A6B0UBW1_IXORI
MLHFTFSFFYYFFFFYFLLEVWKSRISSKSNLPRSATSLVIIGPALHFLSCQLPCMSNYTKKILQRPTSPKPYNACNAEFKKNWKKPLVKFV